MRCVELTAHFTSDPIPLLRPYHSGLQGRVKGALTRGQSLSQSWVSAPSCSLPWLCCVRTWLPHVVTGLPETCFGQQYINQVPQMGAGLGFMWPASPSCKPSLLCDAHVLASPPSRMEDKASVKSNPANHTL